MKKVFKSSGLIAFSSLLLLLSSNTNLIAAVNNSAPKPVSSTPADEANRLRISSDEAKYDRKNKVAMANGHVKITQDNMTIYTSSVMYNENTHTSFIDNFVRIINLDKETNRKTDISANKMIIYHQEKKVHLEDKVRFDREEERKIKINIPNANKNDRQKTEDAIRRERTVITSDFTDYWTKTGDAVFTGNAVFLQKEKKASGDTITVKNDANKNTDTVTIDKNAKLIQIRGDWLVNEGIINPKEDKEKERLVKERLEMNADNIVIYQKTSDLVGNGNVKIVQNVSNKTRQATGQHSVYNDINKTMTLTGNVRIKRENEDWLTAEKAVFHTDSENFEVYAIDPGKPQPAGPKKQVESEFLIPDEEKPTPEPPINSPPPNFNLDENKNNANPPKPSVQPSPSITPAKSASPMQKYTPPNPMNTPAKVQQNNQNINPFEPAKKASPTPQPSKNNSNKGEFNLPSDDKK